MIHVEIEVETDTVPLQALLLRTRCTDGGTVDDPSVSASYLHTGAN